MPAPKLDVHAECFPTPAWVSRKGPGIYELNIAIVLDSDSRSDALKLCDVAMQAIEAKVRLWKTIK